jgi:N-acetylglucosamine kinase
VILSLDGGATKTVAAVLDENEMKIRGIGVSGPSNLIAVPREIAESNAMKAIDDSLNEASTTIKEIDQAIFGLSGMGDSRELDRMGISMIQKLTSRDDFTVINDGLPAFALAHIDSDGIVFAGGTGSVAYYRLQGETKRVGGWNWFIGDDGSASWIAKRALNIATLEYDAIHPGKLIVEEAEKYFKMEFREAIAFVNKHQDKRLVSGFAPKVSALALSGYPRAMRILDESAEYVSNVIVALSGKFKVRPKISLIGGTMQAGKSYTDLIMSRIGSPVTVFYGYHVAIGGLIILLRKIGTPMQESLRDSLVGQMNTMLRRKGKRYWGEYINVE